MINETKKTLTWKWVLGGIAGLLVLSFAFIGAKSIFTSSETVAPNGFIQPSSGAGVVQSEVDEAQAKCEEKLRQVKEEEVAKRGYSKLSKGGYVNRSEGLCTESQVTLWQFYDY